MMKAQTDETVRKCLTDELHHQLQTTYPQGVPGKPIPNSFKQADAEAEFSYVIPVVVHVMHNNGPEQLVTLAQAQSQIEVLNEDYGRYGRGYNTSSIGADVKIRFCLASVDPSGAPTTGIDYYLYANAANLDPFTQDTFMKKVVQWDPERYLNVWTVRRIASGQIEGYSYFPNEVAGTIWDGLVIRHSSFGRFEGTALTLGRTATHEIGHYLGLQHPWGNVELGCYVLSDECDDTPPVGEAYFSTMPACNAPAACDGTLRQIENYMDYSADGCMNLFTQCQRDRMHTNLVKYRPKLVSKENLTLAGCGAQIDLTAALGNIFVYPNPADRYLMVNVDLEEVGTSSIDLVDVNGRKVYSNSAAIVGRGIFNLDLSQFLSGSYHLMVKNDKQYLHQTIIVVR